MGALILFSIIGTTVPLSPAIGITLSFEGCLETILAFQQRSRPAWNWILVSGFVDIVIGILIASQFTAGAVWLLGTLIGVGLILTGLWFLMISRSLQTKGDI